MHIFADWFDISLGQTMSIAAVKPFIEVGHVAALKYSRYNKVLAFES